MIGVGTTAVADVVVWPRVGASSTTQQLQKHGRIGVGRTLTVTST